MTTLTKQIRAARQSLPAKTLSTRRACTMDQIRQALRLAAAAKRRVRVYSPAGFVPNSYRARCILDLTATSPARSPGDRRSRGANWGIRDQAEQRLCISGSAAASDTAADLEDGSARPRALGSHCGLGLVLTLGLGANGTVPLSDLIRQSAIQLAAADYARCVAEEFCSEEVRDVAPPAWLGEIASFFPAVELLEMGLRPRADRAHMYATCGVAPHIDDMDGLSVGVVLHSDGFTFKQRGVRQIKLRAGDWFIFDDRVEHEVLETESATTLLVLTAPLQPL